MNRVQDRLSGLEDKVETLDQSMEMEMEKKYMKRICRNLKMPWKDKIYEL